MDSQARNAIKLLLYGLLILVPGLSIAQQSENKGGLQFVGTDPTRDNRPMSPTGFISNVERDKVVIPRCEYSFGSIQFKVTKNNVIDSVTATGTIYPSLKDQLIRQAKKSGPYWKCSDCEKEGYWVSLPVFLSYQAGCENNPGPKTFWDFRNYFYDTLEKWGKKDEKLDGFFIAPRRLILSPLSLYSIR